MHVQRRPNQSDYPLVRQVDLARENRGVGGMVSSSFFNSAKHWYAFTLAGPLFPSHWKHPQHGGHVTPRSDRICSATRGRGAVLLVQPPRSRQGTRARHLTNNAALHSTIMNHVTSSACKPTMRIADKKAQERLPTRSLHRLQYCR